MKVKFLETVLIQNKFTVNKCDILTAEKYHDEAFIITLKNKRKAVAPISDLGKVFEIVEE